MGLVSFENGSLVPMQEYRPARQIPMGAANGPTKPCAPTTRALCSGMTFLRGGSRQENVDTRSTLL